MKNKDLKFVFFGTSDFAKTILEELVESEYKPVLVVTTPDKPTGRKKELTPSPVKVLSDKYSIPTLQPEDLHEAYEKLSKNSPDLFIVASYGKIIPKEILDIPSKGALNVHPSLLPRWRGAAPIQYSLLHGEKETGITIMLMDEKMDHGPIIAQEKHAIHPDDNTETLSQRLAKKSADILLDVMVRWIEGELQEETQDHDNATYTQMIKKEDGKIDWERKTAQDIKNMLRAYTPWPGIFTFWNDKRLRIIDLKIDDKNPDKQPGKVVEKDDVIAVQTKKGTVIPLRVQLEGRQEQDIKEFLNGYPQILNSILG